ncbi:MAG: phage holin family protein [Actinomycetia bacterium]|nr:phage holin family protein [Actinomycetes bacterium]
MKFLIRTIFIGIVIFAISQFTNFIWVDDIKVAIFAAFLLALINAIIRPIVVIMTFPINLMTLGLFTFVINALMLLLVDILVPGISLSGLFNTLIVSIMISICSTIFSWMISD